MASDESLAARVREVLPTRPEPTEQKMFGGLYVDAEGIATEEDLAEWVGIAAAFAGSLPPKWDAGPSGPLAPRRPSAR